MTQRDEITITEIRPDEVTSIAKIPGVGYRFRVIYVLEDGTEEHSTETRRLLRDAKAELMSLPKSPAHPMKACYSDGEFWGTSTSYYIGPRVGVTQ